MINAPATLGRVIVSLEWVLEGRVRWENTQLCMVEKVFGGFSKTREKARSVFMLITVEVPDRVHVEEFVKESAAPPPLVSITGAGNVP